MYPELLRHTGVTEIVGDVLRVRARDIALGELALIENPDGEERLARAIELDDDLVTLQVFGGGRGLSTGAAVRFLGRPLQVPATASVLGRIFTGAGEPRDAGPTLAGEPRAGVLGLPVNPVARALPTRMIRTDVPMIDVFNTLVETQKIPIFSVPGQPYDALLARIGFQADADVIVFGGLGLSFDDFHYFRSAFEDHGTFHRTVMFVNLALDPVIERLLVPDLCLAVAERFAVEERRRVLVLLTDMTSYAEAQREVGVMLERIPSNRGYLGDLYTQLAVRYEKAASFSGAGLITILAVTTMPGDDVTHPVPDNTGYITEGQFYLRDGLIDPFGSLSRLKQHVLGKGTREDHAQLANTMIRLYAGGEDAARKRGMGFELSDWDRRLLRYADLFRDRFMRVEVSLPLEQALDRGWLTLAECFVQEELLMQQALIDRHWPGTVA